MADVAFDHNMDFSIDTQGPLDNNDDIEIDLDVQELVQDRDDDVMVDDASVTAPGHPEYQNDADMVDEDYNEGNAINLEYAYQQPKEFQYANQDTYGAGNTYEAEMEDEYEEDIDAPIPGTGTLELQGSIAEEVHTQHPEPFVPEPSHDKSKSTEHTKPSPISRTESVGPQGPAAGSKEDENTLQRKEDVAEQPQEGYYDENHERNAEELGGETEQNEPAFESAEDSEEKADTAPADEDVDYESSQESAEEVNLRNVKVLYQDSEISLFPPMEDDPTETYFIEELALAHEPIGKLFHACRSVLDEHITEQEELVIDIESLNLHLSEVSCSHEFFISCISLTISQNASHISSITLSQITKVYRDLALNDGVNDPEPLYLTLSTRESFESAYHNLLQFVEDGKGLSSIHSWDVYEQEEAEGDTLIPEHDGADASKPAAEDHPDESPAQASLEFQEPDFPEENADESVHPPPGQSVQEAAAPEDIPGDNVNVDEIVRRKSPEQGASEETQAAKDEHNPRGVEQPAEDESIGKTNGMTWPLNLPSTSRSERLLTSFAESGHQQPQEYVSSEEGYLELSNEVEETGQPDVVDIAEEARQVDAEGEYSITDDTNSAPQWPEEQERPKSPTLQPHQQPVPEEANEASREENGFDYDTRDSYQALDTDGTAKYDHAEIDVGNGLALEKDDNVDHPAEDVNEPEIDVSIENDVHPDHESGNEAVDLPNVEVEAASGTPGTGHGLFDIEEDIFKSPVAQPATLPQMDDSNQEFTLQVASQEQVQSGVEANGETQPDVPDLESGEVSAFDDEEAQIRTEESHPGKSPSAKRPRPEDANDTLELQVPELKRHRSE